MDRCGSWDAPGDWDSRLKFMMVLTDGAAHTMVDPFVLSSPNADDYDGTTHPNCLTCDGVVGKLISRGIDLFICTFNPTETAQTEQQIVEAYRDHPGNKDEREVTVVPLIPAVEESRRPVSYDRHIVFVLDESRSMRNDWVGVVAAYNRYIERRKKYQCNSDLVSVVQFSKSARTTVNQSPIGSARTTLNRTSMGTRFEPAARVACEVARGTPSSHTPVVVFMSDGEAPDATAAASLFVDLNQEIKDQTGSDLELYVIAFRSRCNKSQLRQIAGASPMGTVRSSSDTEDLTRVFEEIAGGAQVADLLEAEIGKRISDAIGDKLALEFLG